MPNILPVAGRPKARAEWGSGKEAKIQVEVGVKGTAASRERHWAEAFTWLWVTPTVKGSDIPVVFDLPASAEVIECVNVTVIGVVPGTYIGDRGVEVIEVDWELASDITFVDKVSVTLESGATREKTFPIVLTLLRGTTELQSTIRDVLIPTSGSVTVPWDLDPDLKALDIDTFDIDVKVAGGGPGPGPGGGFATMTGGGSLSASRVTHGFHLQCDTSGTGNNLQVNFGRGDKFHLETLTSADCTNDTNIDAGKPVAGLNTYSGTGTGRLNGVSGFTIEFKFTDAGEPGSSDFAEIKIIDADGNPVPGLEVSGPLQDGNHQAHREKQEKRGNQDPPGKAPERQGKGR